MEKTQNLYLIADELRGMAEEGLHFSTNEYDKDRYARLFAISAQMVSILANQPYEEIFRIYQRDITEMLPHTSPIIGGVGIIRNEEKILLIQRNDSKKWGLPGGLINVGESLAEGVQREVYEEIGIKGIPTRLLAIFDSRYWSIHSRLHGYLCWFEFEIGDQQPQTSLEALDFAYFGEDDLANLPLHPGVEKRLPLVFKQFAGEAPIPYFDRIEESID